MKQHHIKALGLVLGFAFSAIALGQKAESIASEKSAEARDATRRKVADARRDATAEKLAVEYGVAKQKCDTHAGDTRDNCLSHAKARYTNP